MDDLSAQCLREIEDLHAFFVEWFTGRIENSDEHFARLAEALAADFRYVLPGGQLVDRAAVLTDLKTAHGRHTEFYIEIRNSMVLIDDADSAVIFFEEHQWAGHAYTARFNTALFRPHANAPNGVVWAFLHETWQAGLGPAGDAG